MRTMTRKVIVAALLFLLPVMSAFAQSVKVNIGWHYTDFKNVMTIHEIKGQPRLWEMKSVKSLDKAPVGAEITASSFQIEPGESKRFALVVRNDSNETKYFFAAPHMASPAEYSLGFKFKCLCINKAYSVGPHETWYRIVDFRIFDGFVGEELTLTHSVIGIDQARAKSFSIEESNQDF